MLHSTPVTGDQGRYSRVVTLRHIDVCTCPGVRPHVRRDVFKTTSRERRTCSLEVVFTTHDMNQKTIIIFSQTSVSETYTKLDDECQTYCQTCQAHTGRLHVCMYGHTPSLHLHGLNRVTLPLV